MLNGKNEFAEVQYFFKMRTTAGDKGYAMVSIYSPPDAYLLKESYGAVYSCWYRGDADLRVIEAKNILSVVAMVPHPASQAHILPNMENRVFVMEKLGLDVMSLTGIQEQDGEEEPQEAGPAQAGGEQ